MSKVLDVLHHPRIELAKIDISAEGLHDIAYMPFYKTKQYTAIEKELKALDFVKPLFRLKGNCLQIYCPFADNDDNYMFVKEIENEEELNVWKEVLL